MGGVCGVAVESDAVRISYFRDGHRVEDSIDAEGARWLLNGKLVDCGPFDDVVLTGRDSDVVESLLASLDATGRTSTIRMVDEGAALLAYARSIDELSSTRALLVLDLGRHGTSAFTLNVAGGAVVRSARRSALSGAGLDTVVESIVLSKGILPPAHGPEAEAEYRAFFRDLKELLTTSAGVRAPGNGPMLITRDEFDDAVTPTFLQTLSWAAPDEPDAVLLIGGGARIPLARTLVEQEWNVPVLVPEAPESVILEGAALEAEPLPPQMDLAAVLDDPVPVITLDLHEQEPPTEPLRVAPATELSAEPDIGPVPVVSSSLPVEASSTPVPQVSRPSEPRKMRKLRWSVRDAMGLAGIAAIVVVVWAVVVLRGNTPPPPGIGVEPEGAVTPSSMEGSVAEGVPTLPPPSYTAEQDFGASTIDEDGN